MRRLGAGARVMVPVPRGSLGTIVKPAITRRGWGDTIFAEVKLDDGTTVYPRASQLAAAPTKETT